MAVCCCSDFGQIVGPRLHFVEQPHVFDRDHRLVGEGGHQFDLLVRKRLHHGLGHEDHADDLAIAQQWCSEGRPVAADLLCLVPGVLGVGQHIGDVHDPAFKRAAPGDAASIDRDVAAEKEAPDLLMNLGPVAEAGGPMQVVAVTLEQPGMVGLAQPGDRFHQRIEHGLQIEGRAADHLQHVGGGGLLLQRLLQVIGARLNLVEQPHVLDGDQRLIRKGRNQIDLPFVERLHDASRQNNDADRNAIAQQRDAQHRAIAPVTRHAQSVIAVRPYIQNVNRPALQRDATHHRAAVRRNRVFPEKFDAFQPGILRCRQLIFVVMQTHDVDMLGFAEMLCSLGDGVEHRLNIRWRPRDDIEHAADRRLKLQRLLQIFGARLHLVEQSGILDRDDRLIGEGRHQFDLPVREGLYLRPHQRNDADRGRIQLQGDAECGAIFPGALIVQRDVFRIGQAIRQVNGLLLECGPADQRAAAGR